LEGLFAALLENTLIKSRKKAEKKLENSRSFKIEYVTGIRIFVLCFLIPLVAVMVWIAVAKTTAEQFWILEGILTMFTIPLFFVYLYFKSNYYSVSEENIVHYRLFGKSKTIEYSDIFYILYRNKGDFLTAYNKYGTILFHIENAQIGIERLTDILEEKGIRHETSELITEEMANSEEYQLKQRKNKFANIIILAIVEIAIIGVFLLCFYLDGK
jgi:hypothetical protein